MATVAYEQFTVAQYDHLIARGFLAEDDPVELIRGEILQKMPVGSNHVATVNRLTQLLSARFSPRAQVSVQNPVVFVDSEPEPDVALLKPKDDFYASRKPTPQDVLLLIEVADSSLLFDREEKLPLYAEADIADVWIVNLTESQIEVYRDPDSGGQYRNASVFESGATISLAAFPDVELSVDEILGQ